MSLDSEEKAMAKLDEVKELVIKGKKKLIADAVNGALEEGNDAAAVLNTMIDAMGVIGEQFKNDEIFVPEMLVAARAMKAGVAELKPHLAQGVAGALGKVVIGTVQGDLHDIGKNLVAMMIESAGFEVIDLGSDVSAERFLEACESNPGVKIVALSALLTTTMSSMKDTIELIKGSPCGKEIRFMIGGAPITQEFADSIGADAYTPDCASAAEVAKELAL